MAADMSGFEKSSESPSMDSKAYVSGPWEDVRDSGISPLNQSELSSDLAKREEFISGARLMGLVGRARELKPQQLRLADVCAVGQQFVGVLLPRRSAKTTSLFALALGRCAERMDYAVAYTACTSGGKARDRFRKDIVPVLEKVYPDPDSRPFKIRKAGGSERIEFDNGSIFQVLPPMGESYRGDSFDLVILDEAGEATAAMTEDLLGAILPTTDTREDAQIIVAGTAAPFRDGNLLWDTLKDGRDGKASTAIIEYAAPDSTNMDDLEDWDLVVPLVLAAHPGIGTLTTLEKMQANYEKITPAQFAAEYLSIFGNSGAATGLINSQLWTLAGDDGALPSVPDTFGLAMSVHPDGLGASLAAAWRVDGVAHVGLLWHSTRPAGLVARALAVAREHRVAIVHDGQASATTVEADILARERPRPRMAPQLWGPVSTAASLFVKELDAMNMRHYSQPAFDEAVRVAVKRGTATSNKWGFGRPRKDPSADITPLEAAALALYYYDEAKPRPKLKPSFG